MEEIIKHQAHHDTLTDLPNRQLFMDFLSLELAQARRNEKRLALMFLDLDGFKQVNDTFGHSNGDISCCRKWPGGSEAAFASQTPWPASEEINSRY